MVANHRPSSASTMATLDSIKYTFSSNGMNAICMIVAFSRILFTAFCLILLIKLFIFRTPLITRGVRRTVLVSLRAAVGVCVCSSFESHCALLAHSAFEISTFYLFASMAINRVLALWPTHTETHTRARSRQPRTLSRWNHDWISRTTIVLSTKPNRSILTAYEETKQNRIKKKY